ncbi:DUF2931 family protein [Chryseobacterium wanjuense]
MSYVSAVDNLVYKGKVKLPQEKILALFKKYDIGDKKFAHLVVGMAPGGWVGFGLQQLMNKLR